MFYTFSFSFAGYPCESEINDTISKKEKELNKKETSRTVALNTSIDNLNFFTSTVLITSKFE